MDTTAEEATKLCNNCHAEIPVASYTLHEAHCARNIRYCRQCDTGVTRSTWDEHIEEYHTKIPCTKCKQDIVKADEENHLAEKCGYRSVRCDLCELDLFAKDLADHESYCKTRTERCDRCRNYINVQELDLHECVPYDEARSRRTSERVAATVPGVGATNGDDATDGPFHRFQDLAESLDDESRILLDIQLQEIERQRARDVLTNGDGPTDYSAPFNYTSRESTYFTEDNVEVECPNCSLKLVMSKIQDHLIECTVASNGSVENNGLENSDLVASTTLDHFDGEITCELCGAGIEVEQYETHIATCPEETDPFGYGLSSNHFDSVYNRYPTATNGNSNYLPSNGVTVADEPNNEIPCEFCHIGVEFEKFEDHMLVCLGDRNANGVIGGDGFALDHSRQNGNDSFLPHDSRHNGADNVSNPANETEYLLPCEFCSESFVPEVLGDHQRGCRWTQMTNFDTDINLPPRLAEENTFDSPAELAPVYGNSFYQRAPRSFMDNPTPERNFDAENPTRSTNFTRIWESPDNLRPSVNSVRYTGGHTEKGTQTFENGDARNQRESVPSYRNYDKKYDSSSYLNNRSGLSGYHGDMSRIGYNPRFDPDYRSQYRTGMASNVKKRYYDTTWRPTSDQYGNDSVSNGEHSRRSVFERLSSPSMLPNGDSVNGGSVHRPSGYFVSSGADRTGSYHSPAGAIGGSSLVPPVRRSSKPGVKTNPKNDRNHRQQNGQQ